MENILGINIRLFENAVIVNSVLADNITVGQDCFIRDSKIGNECLIERRNVIDASTVGDYSYTGYNTVIKHTAIGKFTSISWNVSIGGANHDFRHITNHPFPLLKRFGICSENEPYSSFNDTLQIGNDVWIGSNACILRNVSIGNGAIIGAGAVVTHNVGAYEIWAGVPAKKIGMRFTDNLIEKLSLLSWWDLPIPIIRNNVSLFKEDLTEEIIDKMLLLKNDTEESV